MRERTVIGDVHDGFLVGGARHTPNGGAGRGARACGGGTDPRTAVDVEPVLPRAARRSAPAFLRASGERKPV